MDQSPVEAKPRTRIGATVKQAQVLARHSTPVLTLEVYSHVAMRELTNALEAMPAMTTIPSNPTEVEKVR